MRDTYQNVAAARRLHGQHLAHVLLVARNLHVKYGSNDCFCMHLDKKVNKVSEGTGGFFKSDEAL